MIGILITSHGKMAEGMLNSVGILSGNAENVVSVGLFPEDSSDDFEQRLRKAVDDVDKGDGVLILSDIIGGTTTNKALTISTERKGIEVFTGVNLPMLLEAIVCREYNTMAQMCDILKATATETVVHASERMESEQDNLNEKDELDDLLD